MKVVVFKYISLFHFIFSQIIAFVLLNFFSYKKVQNLLKCYPFTLRYLKQKNLNQEQLMMSWASRFSLNCLTSSLVITELFQRLRIQSSLKWSVSNQVSKKLSAHCWVQTESGLNILKNSNMVELSKVYEGRK